jgi:hypothetical protein
MRPHPAESQQQHFPRQRQQAAHPHLRQLRLLQQQRLLLP